MWDRSSRHCPLTQRCMEYRDNRPVLPQDATRGYFGFRKLYNPYNQYYFKFIIGGKKRIILSTNMQAKDRDKLLKMLNYYGMLIKNLNLLVLIPAIFLYAAFFKGVQFKHKFSAFGIFVFNYYLCRSFAQTPLNEMINKSMTYYYMKYQHISVNEFSEVKDKRREFFRPDTSIYYRETPQEIFDQKGHHLLHDGSIYYGPHPFDDHENVESVVETNRKFMTGESIYDSNELILGETIDVKRKIYSIPSVEEYKQI